MNFPYPDLVITQSLTGGFSWKFTFGWAWARGTNAYIWMRSWFWINFKHGHNFKSHGLAFFQVVLYLFLAVSVGWCRFPLWLLSHLSDTCNISSALIIFGPFWTCSQFRKLWLPSVVLVTTEASSPCSAAGWNLSSHLGHRTECCIAASSVGGASTCSDVPAWPSRLEGARRSPGVTGSRAVRRWRCTASMDPRATGGHRRPWSNSSGS